LTLYTYYTLYTYTYTDTFRHPETFLSFRVIEEWNGLSETVVNSHTVDTFKKKLECHFKN